MSWQRLYNFQQGTTINSAQVNGEFNQLIAAANDLEATKETPAGAQAKVNGLLKGAQTFEGPITFTKQPFVQANSKDNFQTLSSGVRAKIIMFNDVSIDVQGEFASNRYTAKNAGYYLISVYADWGPGIRPAGDQWIRLYRNGSELPPVAYAYGGRIVKDFAIVKLSMGDYVEMYLEQNSGSSVQVQSVSMQIGKFM